MNKKLILSLSSAFIAIILVLGLVYYYTVPFKVVTYAMDITVPVEPKSLGFNVDKDALHFGTVPIRSHSTRDIVLNSGRNSNVVLSATGDFADWVTLSDNNFMMSANEKKIVTATATVPENVTLNRDYNGTIKISFYREPNPLK